MEIFCRLFRAEVLMTGVEARENPNNRRYQVKVKRSFMIKGGEKRQYWRNKQAS